ncbi:hypothetical protein Pint_35441 [Pistacia integerrima]|uniref:Uncharacterized protein n=1 Tax=Pistacia integerrima TaxID=434235 RepID=A0ACC0Y4F8_9ROSI|nr:hypothetical protein Pint_35441 [Pistacia integerrima]
MQQFDSQCGKEEEGFMNHWRRVASLQCYGYTAVSMDLLFCKILESKGSTAFSEVFFSIHVTVIVQVAEEITVEFATSWNDRAVSSDETLCDKLMTRFGRTGNAV